MYGYGYGRSSKQGSGNKARCLVLSLLYTSLRGDVDRGNMSEVESAMACGMPMNRERCLYFTLHLYAETKLERLARNRVGVSAGDGERY